MRQGDGNHIWAHEAAGKYWRRRGSACAGGCIWVPEWYGRANGCAAMCSRVLEALVLGGQADGCGRRKVQFEHVRGGTTVCRGYGRVREAVVGSHTTKGSGKFWVMLNRKYFLVATVAGKSSRGGHYSEGSPGREIKYRLTCPLQVSPRTGTSLLAILFFYYLFASSSPSLHVCDSPAQWFLVGTCSCVLGYWC
ncbi:hypothetical protein BDR03DRAFT_946393 [Suillus americanus]|nr:hypothetical protein BDR03DRAFT_946393 [Suillus americanus]